MAFEIVDGMTGTKHISSDDLAALNIATVGKADCVLGYGEDFKLTMASSASATLGTGVGMVGGRRFWSASRVSLDIQPGEQGRKRNDLVVARYSTTSEGIEGIQPVVIGGTPTTGTPADPDTTSDDLKLWRIPLDGISIGEPVRLFDPVIPLAALGDSVSPSKTYWGSTVVRLEQGNNGPACKLWDNDEFEREFGVNPAQGGAVILGMNGDGVSQTWCTAVNVRIHDDSVWVDCIGASIGLFRVNWVVVIAR